MLDSEALSYVLRSRTDRLFDVLETSSMNGKRQPFWYRAARLGLVGIFVLLGLGRLGEIWPLFDMINLIAGPLALASLLLAVVMLIRARTWAGRALTCACLVPGIVLMMPERNEETVCGPSARTLRVAWINTRHLKRSRAIADWLERAQPQIVGVAELKPALSLRKVLEARYPYWQSCLGNGRCSTLLYSRIAPSEQAGLAHGDPENRKALSAVRMSFGPGSGGKGVPSLAGVHIFAAHLSRPLPLGRQRHELRELDQNAGLTADAIVMGDMNMSPRMQVLNAFAARNGLRLTRTDRPTWPVHIHGYDLTGFWQIDHLLLGSNWKVVSIRTGPDVGSDHRGYVADLCHDRQVGAVRVTPRA
jgi:endonuclease/exonuclease/phosphatase (EEP) superfamily protein YafD